MMSSSAELRQFHHEGSLCLFVGAGVSKDSGLPDWGALSKAVIEKAWPNQTKGIDYQQLMARIDISNLNPLDSMRMARRKLIGDFNPVVSDCLYSRGVTASPIVESIVSLKHLRRICSFNYDDVIEEAYNKKGVASQPLTAGDETPSSGNSVLIFHPHGFLPRANQTYRCSNAEIVLSEDDYHELYASPYSWANLVQLNLLMSFNVLFIGCSLKDPNIRRLLDVCKKLNTTQRYFAIMKKPDYESDKRWFSTLRSFQLVKEVEEPLLKDRGITPIWVQNYPDIPSILNAMM